MNKRGGKRGQAWDRHLFLAGRGKKRLSVGVPRIARGVISECYFHVLNRRNHRQMLFRQSEEFTLFMELLAQSVAKFGVELWG